MFSNPVYNLPPQFNENILNQNLAGLSLNPAPQQQQQQQHQQQHNFDFGSLQFQQHPQQPLPIEIGGYVPPAIDSTTTSTMKWPSPEDLTNSYQQGFTVVRQFNNSMIDDYYKKFLRPITDYVAIPTNGPPTYVYQNLGGQPSTGGAGVVQTQQSDARVEVSNEQKTVADGSSHGNGSEEKKHKKKHKKRSSKHSNGEGTKHSDGEKIVEERKMTSPFKNDQSTIISAAPTIGNNYQQQVLSPPADVKSTGGPQAPMRYDSNPVVYFDIEIDDDARGRLVMELFRHVLPRTAQNFLSLCANIQGFGYRLSYFHRIIPGFMAQGGDFEKSNGTGGYSIYGEKFDDEGFPFRHDRPGLLSMANSGPNTNGSQFFITFVPCPHLDNKHVVFGQVLQGFHILKDLELSGSDSGDVTREVKIAASGQLQ